MGRAMIHFIYVVNLLPGVGSVITASIALWAAYLGLHNKRVLAVNHDMIVQTQHEARQLHVSINGRMDDLLEKAVIAAKQSGIEMGRTAERMDRAAERAEAAAMALVIQPGQRRAEDAA